MDNVILGVYITNLNRFLPNQRANRVGTKKRFASGRYTLIYPSNA